VQRDRSKAKRIKIRREGAGFLYQRVVKQGEEKKGKHIGRYRRIQSENHAGLTMASDTTVKEARCRSSDGDDEVGSGRDTGPGSCGID